MTNSTFRIQGIGKLHMLEVYAYFDKPTLFACQSLSGQIYLSLWIEDTMDYPRWFYVPLSSKRLIEVKVGNISLRDAFTDPEDGWLWEVRLTSNNASIYRLEPSQINQDDLPEHDAFLNCSESTLPTLDDDPSVLAQRIKRDVINISLEPDGSHRNEIDSDHLGLILVRTQSLLRSLPHKGSVLKGRLPKKIEEATTLKVVGFYAASFGVQLESKEFGDIFGETGATTALETFTSLLNAKADGEQLSNLLESISPKSVTRYLFFLRALRDSGTSLNLEWRSPSNKGASINFNVKDVEDTLDILSKKEPDTSETHRIRGTLIGININRNSFVFRTNDGDNISGTIHDLLNGTVFEVPADVEVELEETLEISPTTQVEKSSYKLLKVF